jgi:AcrR family transcriptional regulator
MSMIEPKQARSQETRRRLLDAAVDILVKDGYLGLSAATVARRAGVSRGAHQHHFPNRQTLLIEALHHLSESEQETLRRRLSAIDRGDDGVVEALDILFDTFCGKLFATILELALASRREPELETAILEEERSIAFGTHEFAERIFGEGAYSNPEFARKWRYCRSVVRGVAALSFLGHPQERVHRQWEYAREQIIALMQEPSES